MSRAEPPVSKSAMTSDGQVETVFVVGAGFSSYAGLPLTSGFTEAILEARELGRGPSRLIVDFLTTFIHDAFDHSRTASAKHWPELEDVFTCIDLSANTGHHLSCSFAPADLRTVRRALLSRIIRMLDQRYKLARKNKDANWRKLEAFFWHVAEASAGFISMNWDTVIERQLDATQSGFVVDYSCDALPAKTSELPDREDFSSKRSYLKALRASKAVSLETPPRSGEEATRIIPIVKIHGSINWLYCDNCRRLFYFSPGMAHRIADQLLSANDLARIGTFLQPKKGAQDETPRSQQQPLYCLCSTEVALGTRIATFSYRKALDFPMFQKSWFAAEELLRSAKRWVFIGYSLPPADYEFKYLLKRIQLSRTVKPEFIVITGGSRRDISRTYDNYQKFFGRSIRKKTTFFSAGLSQDALAAIFSG